MDPVTAIGLAASIIQLTEFTVKVITRSAEYHKAGPRSANGFQDIEARLPLIADTLNNIQSQYCREGTKADTLIHLQTVVDGLKRSIESFDKLLTKLRPAPKSETGKNESSISLSWKAFKSVNKEKDVRRIDQNIQSYLMTLTAYVGSVSPQTRQEVQDGTLQLLDTIPSLAVPKFVGRARLLEEIDECFGASSSTNGMAKIVVLRGMGGQGKTQIALEYSRRRRPSSSLVWIDATSQKTASNSLESLASPLGIQAAEGQEKTVEAVVKTLARHGNPLLMIFDNYDRPSDFPNIQNFLPNNEQCHVIITSRHVGSESLGKSLQVPPFDIEEALELLRHRTGIIQEHQHQYSARQIVQQLGLLPLAIEQAAAYIASRRLTCDDFLEHYESRKALILKETPQIWTYGRTNSDASRSRDLSVFTTWELSLVELGATAEERQPYVDLLVAAAYMDFTNISDFMFATYFKHRQTTESPSEENWSLRSLMRSHDDNGSTNADSDQWDPFIFQDAVARLHNASLIQSMDLCGKRTVFSLHPLVAEWLKMRKDDGGRLHPLLFVNNILIKIASQASYSSAAWNMRDVNETIRHMNNVSAVVSTPNVTDELREDFYYQAGYLARFYVMHSKYSAAERLIEQSLDSGLLEGNRLGYLEGILGEIYLDRDRVEEAEHFLIRGYNSRKDAFETASSAHDSRILRALERIAFLRMVQQRLEESEALYREALQGWLQNGEERRDVLQAERMLGQVLRMQGKLDECEPHLRAAAEGFEQLEGLRNHRTAAARSALAVLYRDRGELETAAAMLTECLTTLESLTGHANVRTVAALTRLGLVEEERGKREDAGRYYELAAYDRSVRFDVRITVMERTFREFNCPSFSILRGMLEPLSKFKIA